MTEITEADRQKAVNRVNKMAQCEKVAITDIGICRNFTLDTAVVLCAELREEKEAHQAFWTLADKVAREADTWLANNGYPNETSMRQILYPLMLPDPKLDLVEQLYNSCSELGTWDLDDMRKVAKRLGLKLVKDEDHD